MSNLIPPVFLKCRDFSEDKVSHMDICRAVTRVVHSTKLDGVQKLNNMWLIYLKDRESRLQLCVKQSLNIHGREIKLYDRNPYEVTQNVQKDGTGDAKRNDKLTIKNLPFSVTNEEVANMLVEKKIELVSTVRHGLLRDDLAEDELTSYKSGDRYVYVKPFDPPLPVKQQVGDFHCIVVHHGKMWPCKSCNIIGHKFGDEVCKAKPTQKIISFKGYQNPLSNDYPCDIHIYDKQFKNVTEAFLWRMSLELGESVLAERILQSKHAGEAKKRFSSVIANDVKWEWEQGNLGTMEQLLDAKAAQCHEFRDTLLEYQDATLADASSSLHWGTGLSPFISEHTAPDYWPGKNTLGAMLMDLTQRLTIQNNTPQANTNSFKSTDSGPESGSIGESDIPNEVNISSSDESTTNALLSQNIEQSTPTRARQETRATRTKRASRSLSSTPRRNTEPKQATKQLDIKTAFSGAKHTKRKTLASSPEQNMDTQGKVLKTTLGVT